MMTPSAASRSLHPFDIKSLGVVEYQSDRDKAAEVRVVIPLYNYGSLIGECLQSVVRQDLRHISITVLDDASTDDGGALAVDILRNRTDRFSQIQVIRHKRNQGLSMARNSGIAWSDEPYLFMLDADNRLRPPALTRLLQAVKNADAAFAYSQLRMFGDATGIGVADIWDPSRLRTGNYIDAMAMLRRDALVAVQGYHVLADDHGWEDYDLWCRLATAGYKGVFLPEALCEYRLHGASMLHTRTTNYIDALKAEMALRHAALFASGHLGSSTGDTP